MMKKNKHLFRFSLKKIILATLLLCHFVVDAQCWKKISIGNDHSAGIKENGTLWTWGYNGYGALGLGSGSGTFITPTQVGTEANWKTVSCGYHFTTAIKNDGTLWSWGSNNEGQLGNGPLFIGSYVPIQIGVANDWKEVSSSGNSTHAMKNDGTIWFFGGSLGNGSPTDILPSNTPQQVGIDNNWVYFQSSGGSDGCFAIKNNGTLWVRGEDDYASNSHPNFLQVGTDNDWVKAVRTTTNTIAIKQNGTLWSWGSGTYNGPLSYWTTTPTQVGTETNWKDIEAGVSHFLALKTDNTLWSCGGSTTQFELGNGNITPNQQFNQIGIGNSWDKIHASNRNSMARKSDGNWFGCGQNTYGEIGNLSQLNVNILDLVPTPNCSIIPIIANPDSGTSTNGVSSTAVANVLTNDTYNGAVANSSNVILSFVNSTNVGITLNNTTGAINVASTVPVGTYTLIYQICATVSPSTCTNGTVTITVLPPVLVANPDSATTSFGVASTPIGNVLANDTYNGAVATSSNTTLSFVSSTNSGITLNTTTGAVSVSAAVPVGTYTLIYKICATASPTTCVNGTVTITVSAPLIIANPDTATTNFGVASTPIANVRANDTYNGAVATSSNTTLSFVSSTNAGITLNATTGAVSVSATVPVGTYTLIYKICATGSTTNCSNGTVTITVNPPSLIANADNATTPFGTVTTPIANVRANDTYNGVVATSSNTTLSFVSSTNAGITLNTSTGAVNKTAAVPAGTYTLIYKICATASPAYCTNGTVTIVVSPPPVLVAVNDSATINYSNTTPTTAVANVRANDTANGAVATASNTTLSLVNSSHSGVTLNVATGAISVNAYVPVGTYTVVYKICSTGSTTNCVNGTATIIVRPVIQAVNDAATVLSGIASTNVVNVRTNDKYNFAAASSSNTTLSVVSTSNSGITLNTSTGMINVASTVPAGVHTLVYNLCSISAPITCATGTVTITVNPKVIANNDSGQSIFSIGGPSINVLNNDTVSGLPATTSNVVITFISSTHPGITLNTSTGVINVAPTVPLSNTIQASYSVTYRICSVGSTTNCATATATIVVFPKLIAYNDYFTILDNAPYTTFSVLTNDTQNDVAPLQITNYVQATPISNSNPYVFMGTGGTIVVNPSAPVGTHTVNYKIRWGTYLPEVSSSATAYINVVSSTSSRIEKNEIIKIYPNPSNGIFNLDLSNSSEEYNKITVFNLLGKTIYTNSLNPKSNNEIDLTGFPSGYYLAHIENSLNNTSKQVKLIKQ